MKLLFSILALLFVPHLPDIGQSTTITGLASVIDGDTIEIHGQRIRLFGIDAPESSQRCNTDGESWQCGQKAAIALDDLINGKTVKCIVKDTDRYGRSVCKCYQGTIDINGYLARQGWAVAYRDYSLDYVNQEEYAQANKLGIWNSEFEMPWDYRRSSPSQARTGAPRTAPDARQSESPSTTVKQEEQHSVPQQMADSGSCLIKGNISSSGERIYHPPGSPWYSRTKIDTSKGDRWFCSEEEARRAGWRRAKY